MITYMISKKEIKKLPVIEDTVTIIESLLASGKYSIPDSLENEMYEFFDRYKIFYRLKREKGCENCTMDLDNHKLISDEYNEYYRCK